MKKRAVFMDRDGTINKDVGYPSAFHSIEIFPSSFEAVRQINKAGLLAVIITNQSGVGRGLIAEKNLQHIHRKFQELFARHKAHLDGIYYCPHYLHSTIPEYRKDCSCRKPLPGMAFQAASDLNIDIKKSYMIGDKVEDILFGLNIKAQPVLVQTGFGLKSQKQLKEKGITPAHIAPSLLEAVNWILHKEQEENPQAD